MSKVRPYYQDTTTISTSASTVRSWQRQPATLRRLLPGGDGCGKELDEWFTDAVLHPKPPKVPPKPRPPLTLAQLPDACRQIVRMP